MMDIRSARSLGMASCSLCHKLCRFVDDDEMAQYCPRCGTRLHSRYPNSVVRTGALLITAAICFLPANLYPIMVVSQLGNDTPSTIFGGVVTLVHHGAYGIAAVVFIASLAVPFLKLIGLVILLIKIQRGWHLNANQCTSMYRMIEFIGRWSMLDIFVIALLAALVNLGAVARIEAGPAATAFGLTVVLTMLAAMTFDPRLIWDKEVGDE